MKHILESFKLVLLVYILILSINNNLFSKSIINSLDRKDKIYNSFRKDAISVASNIKSLKKSSLSVLYYKNLPKLKIAYYKIRKGDTLIGVASKSNLNRDTIISVNALPSIHAWKVGETIKIPNMRGILVKPDSNISIIHLAKANQTTPAIISYFNNIDRNTIYKNETVFIPGGKLEREETLYFYKGYTVFEHPFGFIMPTKGRLSSKYGWRKDPFTRQKTYHGGIDIAAQYGTKVYSSNTGTVEFAGWKGGYGKLIIIKHKFGYRTFYGHLSKIVVKKGQKVKKGSLIGKVGSTGRSTGNHLHFEIRRFNRKYNPLNLVHR